MPAPLFGEPEILNIDEKRPLERLTKILLRRAFFNCEYIRVERLAGGKSAKETLRVFASLKGAEVGPQPMPFFLKLGKPRSIEDEKRNYRERAEPFIPFHLRPSLNEGRSVTTLTTAALVCNFVESAVALRDSLRGGYGASALFTLFEITLRGLRIHTLRTPEKTGVIEGFIDRRVRAFEIERDWPTRVMRARELGLRRSPRDIELALKAHAGGIKAREGTYHGDLHVGNIMVRNRDAIVIDFGSMEPFGPLTADPAILEVSLVFGTDNDDDAGSFESWRSFVNEIFLEFPLTPPSLSADHFRFTWLEKAVRELRHVVTCCGVKEKEALIILCASLLRFARLSPPELRNGKLRKLSEDRRAYALIIAERICDKL